MGELGLFTLEKGRLEGDLITEFTYLEGSYKDGVSLFTKSHLEKTRVNGYKLYQQKPHLNLKKKLFTVRTTNH